MNAAPSVHRYAIPAGAAAAVLSHDSALGRLAYLSRRHAERVGLQVDVTRAAAALGFVLPVAITAAALAEAVTWTDRDSRRQCPQHEDARLADVLRALAAAAADARGSVVRFTVTCVLRDSHSRRPARLPLRAECTDGANGLHITISTITEC